MDLDDRTVALTSKLVLLVSAWLHFLSYISSSSSRLILTYSDGYIIILPFELPS